MDKAAVDAVMARMAKSTQQKVLEKTDQMIKENSVYELFDDMEQLTRESEELNKQLGREMGYNPVNVCILILILIYTFSSFQAKRDVALHLSETAEKMLTEADAEIEKIEKELKAEEDEIARRKQVLKELATIVESQQQKLQNFDINITFT